MKLKPRLRRALMIGAVGMALTPLPGMGDAGSEQRLSFDVDEGLNLNSFLRDGPVAAHLLLRSGSDPRVLIAFPAGNSGVGLWFSHSATPATWTLLGRPQPLIIKDERGRPLYGLTADARVTGVKDLSIKQAVLSSVRVLRDYQARGLFRRKSQRTRRSRTRPSPGRAIASTARPDIASASRSRRGRCRASTSQREAAAGLRSRSPP